MVPTKTCRRCEINKPSHDFYRRRASPDGLTCYCQICTRQIQAAYRARLRNSAVAERKVQVAQRFASLIPQATPELISALVAASSSVQ